MRVVSNDTWYLVLTYICGVSTHIPVQFVSDFWVAGRHKNFPSVRRETHSCTTILASLIMRNALRDAHMDPSELLGWKNVHHVNDKFEHPQTFSAKLITNPICHSITFSCNYKTVSITFSAVCCLPWALSPDTSTSTFLCNSSPNMSCTVFVGNLTWSTSNEQLQEFAAPVGRVVSAEVKRHEDTARSKGWG